jgi:hypothetical protein
LSSLDSFLNTTEGTTGGIVKAVNKTIEYPFLYITSITDVELRYLAGKTIMLNSEKDSMPLYLKSNSGGYRMLGYIRVCFDSILRLQHLKYHPIFMKVSKESEKELTGELFDSLLLTR